MASDESASRSKRRGEKAVGSGRRGDRSMTGAEREMRPHHIHERDLDEDGIRARPSRDRHDETERESGSSAGNDLKADGRSERTRGLLYIKPTSSSPHPCNPPQRRGSGERAAKFGGMAASCGRRRPVESHTGETDCRRAATYSRTRGRGKNSSRGVAKRHSVDFHSESNEDRRASGGVKQLQPRSPGRGDHNPLVIRDESAHQSRVWTSHGEERFPPRDFVSGSGSGQRRGSQDPLARRRSHSDGLVGEEGEEGGSPSHLEAFERAERKMGVAVARWARGGNLVEPARFKPVKQAR